MTALIMESHMADPRIIIPGGKPASQDDPKVEMLKSHVAAYTRKDGAFVAEHEDRRQKKVGGALPDDHDFHAHLGSLKDGETQTYGNSVFKGEKLAVKRSGDKFTLSSGFGKPDEMSHEDAAKRIKDMHVGGKGPKAKGERLTDAGRSAESPKAAADGKVEYPPHVRNWTDKAHHLEQIPADKRTPEQKAAYKKATVQAMYGKGYSDAYKAHLASNGGKPQRNNAG
jgi:hypothetical protein